MNSKILIAVVVAIFLLVGGYFVLSNMRGATAPTLEVSQPTTEPMPETTTSGKTVETKEILVEGDEYKFTPASISVTKGESVAIVFKNVGTVRHNFMIKELNVASKLIGPGETDRVEFMASSSGTFSFYCSVPGHKESGMEGELLVR